MHRSSLMKQFMIVLMKLSGSAFHQWTSAESCFSTTSSSTASPLSQQAKSSCSSTSIQDLYTQGRSSSAWRALRQKLCRRSLTRPRASLVVRLQKWSLLGMMQLLHSQSLSSHPNLCARFLKSSTCSMNWKRIGARKRRWFWKRWRICQRLNFQPNC